MFARWKAENLRLPPDTQPAHSLGYLPSSTSKPLDQHKPLLAMSVRKWMRNRGLTVKPKLTEEQTANLQMCFKMMDADGSGAIDAEELHAAFKLLGISVSRKEVEAMLDEVDRDGSGEVEYAEFLEIMTVQLNKMAEEREGSGRGAADPGDIEAGGSAEGDGSVGTPSAAALPFDVVATAYRRKKLLEALDLDDKDFLRSVAEEEERRSTEQAQGLSQATMEKQQQQQQAGRNVPSRISVVHRESGHNPQLNLLGQVPQTNAEFLQTLGRDQKKMIDALTRKFRECQEGPRAAAAATSATQETRRRANSSASGKAASNYGKVPPSSGAEGQRLSGLFQPGQPKQQQQEQQDNQAQCSRLVPASGALGVGRPESTPLPASFPAEQQSTLLASASTRPDAPGDKVQAPSRRPTAGSRDLLPAQPPHVADSRSLASSAAEAPAKTPTVGVLVGAAAAGDFARQQGSGATALHGAEAAVEAAAGSRQCGTGAVLSGDILVPAVTISGEEDSGQQLLDVCACAQLATADVNPLDGGQRSLGEDAEQAAALAAGAEVEDKALAESAEAEPIGVETVEAGAEAETATACTAIQYNNGYDRLNSLIGYRRATFLADNVANPQQQEQDSHGSGAVPSQPQPEGAREQCPTGSLVQCRPSIFCVPLGHE